MRFVIEGMFDGVYRTYYFKDLYKMYVPSEIYKAVEEADIPEFLKNNLYPFIKAADICNGWSQIKDDDRYRCFFDKISRDLNEVHSIDSGHSFNENVRFITFIAQNGVDEFVKYVKKIDYH